jgi:hypothetical protein
MRRRLIPPPNPPIQLSGGETTVQEAHRVRKVQSSTSPIAPLPPRSLHCLPRQNTPFLLSLMLVSLAPPSFKSRSCFSLQIQKESAFQSVWRRGRRKGRTAGIISLEDRQGYLALVLDVEDQFPAWEDGLP